MCPSCQSWYRRHIAPYVVHAGCSSQAFSRMRQRVVSLDEGVVVEVGFGSGLNLPNYDAGKVTNRRSDLDFDGLKSDYGIGIRLHGLVSTPLRIDFAHSNEGLHLVFSASAVF